MSSINPTSSNALRAPVTSAQTNPATPTTAAATLTNEPEQPAPSVTLSLSEYAQKRMATLREATAKLREMQAKQQQVRKEAARQRLADIKQRIAILKQLVVSLGAYASKGALRQLKQLAQELGQVASVLKEDSGGSSSGTQNTDSSSQSNSDADGTQAVEAAAAADTSSEADTKVDADPEAVTGSTALPDEAHAQDRADTQKAAEDKRGENVWSQAGGSDDNKQRRADAEDLKKVVGELKQLLAMVKSQLSAKPDDENKKLLTAINQQLAETEKTASAMLGGGLSIPTSIGSMVSISV